MSHDLNLEMVWFGTTSKGLSWVYFGRVEMGWQNKRFSLVWMQHEINLGLVQSGFEEVSGLHRQWILYRLLAVVKVDRSLHHRLLLFVVPSSSLYPPSSSIHDSRLQNHVDLTAWCQCPASCSCHGWTAGVPQIEPPWHKAYLPHLDCCQ